MHGRMGVLGHSRHTLNAANTRMGACSGPALCMQLQAESAGAACCAARWLPVVAALFKPACVDRHGDDRDDPGHPALLESLVAAIRVNPGGADKGGAGWREARVRACRFQVAGAARSVAERGRRRAARCFQGTLLAVVLCAVSGPTHRRRARRSCRALPAKAAAALSSVQHLPRAAAAERPAAPRLHCLRPRRNARASATVLSMRCLSNGPAQGALVVALLGLLHNLRCPSQLAPLSAAPRLAVCSAGSLSRHQSS